MGEYQPADKIPLSTELRITDEFREAKWEWKFMSQGSRIPLGPILIVNAEDCARAVFTSVVITTNRVGTPIDGGAAAVLIPRLVYVNITGRDGKHNAFITMAMEWSAYDRTQRLIWVDSFRSEFNGIPEGVRGYEKITQKQFDTVLGDLFQQSARSMLASRELRQYAASGGRTAK